MLQLMQIMTHMLVRLEYTPDEVRQAFLGLQDGEYTIDELLDSVGVEPYVPAIMAILATKVPRWESALSVTLMKLELDQ